MHTELTTKDCLCSESEIIASVRVISPNVSLETGLALCCSGKKKKKQEKKTNDKEWHMQF